MSSDIDRDVLQFIADEFRDQAMGVMEDEERKEVEEQFYKHVKDENFSKIEDMTLELEDDYDFSLKEIRSFTEMVKREDLIEATEQKQSTAKLSDGLSQAIKMQVKNMDSNEMIVRTDEEVRVSDLFRIQEQLYTEYEKLAFVISNQNEWQGRISVELSGTKEKLQLLRVYRSEDGFKFRHLGESQSQYKGMKIDAEHTHGFYIYKFVSEDNEYLLFSTEPLDPMTCKVKGMHLKLSDYKQIGENTGLPVDRDIIFAHSVEPAIRSLEEEEVEELAPKVDHDWLAYNLLGDWRHPEWFEKLLIAMLSVNEENGFPSGMLWMAETGTGKSKVLESIARAFREKQGVHTGTASTIKGLTPSFADSPPDEGFLLKTTRVGCVDEVFNLLSGAAQGNGNKKDAFRPLLDLIEHNDRTYSSGNGSIRGKMEGCMIGAGNDSYGISSISEAADTLDEAFLGRFLLYEQTDSHIDFIEDRKYEIDTSEAESAPGDPEFISLMDHLRSDAPVSVDRHKVRDIKKEVEPSVPSSFDAIYRSRYDHHIKNLVAGHAKYRSLVSGSLDFEAKEEDYRFAHETLEILVNSWVDKANLESMSLQARPYYLPNDQRKVFEIIRTHYPIERMELQDRAATEVGFQLSKLMNLDLVEEIDEKYYPYFAQETESEVNKKYGHINRNEGKKDQ